MAVLEEEKKTDEYLLKLSNVTTSNIQREGA